MKRFIIAACATTLISATAVAAPKHKHNPYSTPQKHHHSQRDFNRDLFNLALFVGAAVAIDAALDNDHRDRRHHVYNDNYRPHKWPQQQQKKPSARHANINQRQEKQRDRIRAGIRSGELAPKEAKRLRKQQKDIARLEQRFRADGRFSAKERKIIHNKLDASAKRIYQLKHNRKHRS